MPSSRPHAALALMLGMGAMLAAPLAEARTTSAATVKREWVLAHERFLAGDALQGRGSGTRDEAIAAAYVAAQFRHDNELHLLGLRSAEQRKGRRLG